MTGDRTAADRTAADRVAALLRRLELVPDGETPALQPLPGGVSSDIWRTEIGGREVCIKRALPQLRTAQEWRAPVERNASEADWIRTAAAIVPDAVPELIAEDREAGLFVMAYLDPEAFPVWKSLLRDGEISAGTARAVGAALGRIHAATAGDGSIAERFATDSIFHDIRIEPYLLATAAAHPDMAERLEALAETTATTRRALVHGDVSPKNILAGASGPVFLDAECAWYGDPCFDLAFCLNHLLLKTVWRPQWTSRYLECFAALAAAYLERVDWEDRDAIEARTAALLPGLLLARIDGKSPVEYITDESDKNRVRSIARDLLARGPQTLAGVCRPFVEETTE